MDSDATSKTTEEGLFLERVANIVSPEHRPLTVARQLETEPLEEVLADLLEDELRRFGEK